MKSNASPFTFFRPGRLLATATVLAATSLPILSAQTTQVILLDEMVVSAQRSSQQISQTPSSITLVDLNEIEKTGTFSLQETLAQQPGAIIVNTGATGSQSSLFLRGAASHQTLFLVDGVRLNDRSASYANYLGGADLSGLDRFEVLRGPQGTLYGSSAIGGVIALETAHGVEGASGLLQAEFGSFNTFYGSASISGGVESLGYSLSLSRLQTDNDRSDNAFESWNYSGRLEGQVTDTVLLGATFRGQTSSYEEPGSTLSPFPGTADLDSNLVTVYGDVQVTDGFSSRLTGAYFWKDYTFTSSWGPSPSENNRKIIDWQNTWWVIPQVEIVAGLYYEKSEFEPVGTVIRDDDFALYASGVYRPVESGTLTAGIRRDDYDSVGGATTWRLGASWKATATTHLRTTVGTGFSAPGSEDRFGVPAWGQLPNPDIKPETSIGWDIGIDQEFPTTNTVFSATLFANRYENLFEYEIVDWTTYAGMVVNRDEASTQGVELAAATRPTEMFSARLSYTYLDAQNDTDDVRLIRRPKHTLDAMVQLEGSDRWSAGLGLRGVADRTDQGLEPDDYLVLRAFGRYRIWENLVIKARVENLLNKTFEEVPGYPALPIGFHGGIEWTF